MHRSRLQYSVNFDEDTARGLRRNLSSCLRNILLKLNSCLKIFQFEATNLPLKPPWPPWLPAVRENFGRSCLKNVFDDSRPKSARFPHLIRQRRLYKIPEERVRGHWTGFEFRMKLASKKPGMIVDLNNFHQITAG